MISFTKNKILKSVILFAVILASIGCGEGKNKKPGTAVIEGNIQFPSHDKIYFLSYSDSIAIYLDNKTALDSAIISKNGDYLFELPCTKPMVFNLASGNQNLVTNLFISPGDHLKINFSGRSNVPQIPPFSEEAKYNNYLIKLLDAFYQDPLAKQQYYIVSNYMDLDQFISYNEERKQNQLKFFKEFFRDDSLKKEFSDYALNTIYYGIAVDRLMYLWKKRMKGEQVIADSSYFSFETPAFIENKSAFLCPSYIRFLNLYIKDVYERMVERGELPHEKHQPLIPQVEKFILAKQRLTKPYFDVVIYNLMSAEMSDVSEKKPPHFSSSVSMDSMLVWFTTKYSIK